MKLLYKFVAASAAVMVWSQGMSQVVTTSPEVLQTNSAGIVVTFHSDRGDRGLADLPQGEKVYAHTGVLLNSASSSNEWSFAPEWLDNAPKYELQRTGTNTWTLDIGSIEAYYGISSEQAGEVRDLMFVFRNATGSRTGRAAGGADISVPVEKAGFVVTLSSDVDGTVVTGTEPVTLTVRTSASADISLYLNSVDSPALKTVTGSTELSYSQSLTETGTYTFIATATPSAGGDLVADTLMLSRPVPSVQKDFPGGTPRMGYTLNADGSVTLCLAAPGKKSVMVIGDWNNWAFGSEGSMYFHDYEGNRYFWITLPGLCDDRDHRYYYLVDGIRAVGDPYARLVLDPWNDRYIPTDVFPDIPRYPSANVPAGTPVAVFNSSAGNYKWMNDNFKGVDKSELIIYELLIRDFTGTEGEANAEGTVRGVIDRLDYLQGLGVNAIELLPIMEFGGNNSWGYNTNFYFATDKAYGTPDDYRMLIDECHGRGIAVILDIVFNQSDGLHPWYMMYDIAENPFYNGSAPHAYSVLNDWNQDNELVQRQWHDCLKYWLEEFHVDGFRFDLVKGLGDNDSYGNTYNPETNTFGTPSDEATNRYNASRVARMKALHEVMTKIKPDAYFINENLAGAEEENQMAEDGEINWANINAASVSFACGRSNDMNRFYAPLDSRLRGSTVSYAESHDEQRMAYEQLNSGASGVKGNETMSMRLLGSVAAQMLMTPGAHMIWQFQEMGDAQNTKNPGGGNNTDPKRVVWSLLDNQSHAALTDTYRRLCGLRRSNPELFGNQSTVIYNCGAAQWGSGRTIRLSDGNKELYCVINGRATMPRTIDPGFTSDPSAYTLLLSSPETETSVNGGKVTLQAGAFAIYGNAAVSGIDSPVVPDTGIVILVDGSRTITVTGTDSFEVYDLAGRRISPANVAPGHYIVRTPHGSRPILIN